MFLATRFAQRRLGICASYNLLAASSFSSTASNSNGIPNPPLHLDPTLETLLQDVDMSLKNVKNNAVHKHRELEVVSGLDIGEPHRFAAEEWSPMAMSEGLEEEDMERESRKSPAAQFGSDQIGAVILPEELRSAIDSVIADGQKSLVHSDAKRLFKSSQTGEEEGDWDTHYDTVYNTRKQATVHGVRDGTAFASIALPAHFSAITAVLHHTKRRLSPSWEVNRIIDWGAGTGSGLWASTYAFQHDRPDIGQDENSETASTSRIKSYLGIDKREGLVTIGKRLVNNIPSENMNIRWQKSFRDTDKLLQEDAPNSIALSSFMLSTLPTAVAQKTLVDEMWASGAHTIILVDHDTPEGFKAIAHAREHVLELSRREAEDPELKTSDLPGCHVLAPCPHDRPCPLLHSGGAPLICGFSQRIQRPSFVQRTKHSGVGHEDVQYSYVVIQRGPRPASVETTVGRIGGVGRRVLDKERLTVPIKELAVEGEATNLPGSVGETAHQAIPEEAEPTGSALEAQLRKEAYQWPRLVFPPLKKSGHIILDACTSEGKIKRLTIPKSQGKQPYYDARKSSWGDIFPHAPKNDPQERYQPKTTRRGDRSATGDDIGKRKDVHKRRERASYNALADNLKEKKKLSKKDYAKIRGDKVWYELS